MNIYANPTDFKNMKKLFGHNDDVEPLLSFLNSILGLKEDREIKKLTTIHEEIAADSIFILCMSGCGIPSIIKMKAAHGYSSPKRDTDLFLLESYVFRQKPMTTVMINKNIESSNSFGTVSYHEGISEDSPENTSFVFIELSKFLKKESELITTQDEWVYFFKNCHNIYSPPSNSSEELLKAYELMKI